MGKIIGIKGREVIRRDRSFIGVVGKLLRVWAMVVGVWVIVIIMAVVNVELKPRLIIVPEADY